MRQFAWLYAGLFIGATIILGITVYFSSEKALQQQLDDRIYAEILDLVSVYQSSGLRALASEIEDHEKLRGINQMGYILTDNRGKRLAGSIDAKTPKPGWSMTTFIDREEGADQARAYTTVLSNGGRLVVIADQEAIEAIGETLAMQFLIAFGVMILMGVGGGVLLTRFLHRRLQSINQTAEAIIGGDMSQRIPIRGSQGEFDRLSQTLNRMLNRIESLMGNLRQVSGDIAHDLRSPLTRLRQKLEGALSETVGDGERRTAIDEALLQTDNMLDIFAALLGISEIEGGHVRSTFKNIQLDQIVAEVCDAYLPSAQDAGYHMQCDAVSASHILGNRHLIVQMMTNLLDNCLRHTAAGSEINVQVHNEGGAAVLCVADNGPGIPAEHRDEMLRRFARMEKSRTTPGNGLGLSLVSAIAEAHNANMKLTDNEPGLKVTITFSAMTGAAS